MRFAMWLSDNAWLRRSARPWDQAELKLGLLIRRSQVRILPGLPFSASTGRRRGLLPEVVPRGLVAGDRIPHFGDLAVLDVGDEHLRRAQFAPVALARAVVQHDSVRIRRADVVDVGAERPAGHLP